VRVCGLALLVCLAAGCAAHREPDAAGLFLHRSPTASADRAAAEAPGRNGAAIVEGDSSGARPQAANDPGLSKTSAPQTSNPPTLETTNAGLGAALAELKRHPTAAAYVIVGEEYRRLGVFDEAEANFEHALHIDSRLPAAAEDLARLWRDWGWPERGLPYAYRALSAAPRSPAIENTLGTVLFALGDPEAARTHFEKAVALDPGAAYALNNLCYVALMLGEGGPAIARCDEALALSPNLASSRNNLALVYAAQGRIGEAADEFARAGNGPAADFNMGIVHMARHEYREAVAAFQAACHATPEVPGACAWAAEARRLAAETAPTDIRN
jgi:tetratricopeptide (TPR) repeat protein